MHPLIIQAIATDQVRAIQKEADARQRAAAFRRTSAGGPRRWLRWPGPERGPAYRAGLRSWRDPRAA